MEVAGVPLKAVLILLVVCSLPAIFIHLDLSHKIEMRDTWEAQDANITAIGHAGRYGTDVQVDYSYQSSVYRSKDECSNEIARKLEDKTTVLVNPASPGHVAILPCLEHSIPNTGGTYATVLLISASAFVISFLFYKYGIRLQ